MPSDDTVRGVAVRIKLEADRIQLFDLLFERVKRLLRKYGIDSRINLEPIGPSFAGLTGLLYAAPAVLECVYRSDMMTGEIIVAFDEKHLCGFREPPVARELLTWKPVSHLGQAIVSAIEGIDNGSRIPACSIIVFSKIVAVRRCIDNEYVFNQVSLLRYHPSREKPRADRLAYSRAV